MSPTDLLLDSSSRLCCAVFCGLAYVAVCAAVVWREWCRRKQFAAVEPVAADSPACLVVFASQTGTAEALALHTAQRLNLAGVSAHLLALDAVTLSVLQQYERALFIVSTYGEGNAPDNAARFEAEVMEATAALTPLHYGILALGDATYVEYCGFGRRLDAWLHGTGAVAQFQTIEVDRGDEHALVAWQQQLSHIAGSSDAPDWRAPAFEPWRLQSRRQLNPGSAGAPLYELMLVPENGVMPDWESGDLAQIQAEDDATRPRDYSIASLPHERCVQLLIRLHRDDDGRTGLVSGWLTQTAVPGTAVQLRVRPHRLFRLGNNAERPLILIGNGSGLAGLLGHLKARIANDQHANWLIYGERNAEADSLYASELGEWQQRGYLQRLDRTFSRDDLSLRYVQDVVQAQADVLREWVTNGAAIYVCGSLQGMAAGVDETLVEVLGETVLNTLKLDGRYRRDVY